MTTPGDYDWKWSNEQRDYYRYTWNTGMALTEHFARTRLTAPDGTWGRVEWGRSDDVLCHDRCRVDAYSLSIEADSQIQTVRLHLGLNLLRKHHKHIHIKQAGLHILHRCSILIRTHKLQRERSMFSHKSLHNLNTTINLHTKQLGTNLPRIRLLSNHKRLNNKSHIKATHRHIPQRHHLIL